VLYGNRLEAAGIYLPLPAVAVDETDGDLHRPLHVSGVSMTEREARVRVRKDQVKYQKKQYRMTVEAFVAEGSSIASSDILKVEISPFAIPLSKLKSVHGESSMGWTEFVVAMNDGKRFLYGTSFSIEFFALPVEVEDIEMYSWCPRSLRKREQYGW